jgi:DMSO/TMAO reductase YedYZ molybdopterin-dependent catalytic subunit
MADPKKPGAASRIWLPAAAGVASVAAGVGAAEIAAALFAPTASPILVVGSLVIDLVPAWLKAAVISVFGTNDKSFLLFCLTVVIIVVAGLAGVVEARKPPIGRVIFAIGGLIGAFAAYTRTASTVFSVVPSLIAAAVAAILLVFFIRRLPRAATPAPATLSAAQRRAQAADQRYGTTSTPATNSFNRRSFLAWTGGLAAVGVIAAVGGQLLAAGAKAASAARAILKLPKPAVVVPPVPAGASFSVPGITPIVTSNANFYRIDTALQIPQIDPTTWSLHITGMVENEIKLTWAELLKLPLEESYTTLTCVSDEVGDNLISNAKWLGYPIRHLLARAKPTAGADMVFSTSQDGWTAGTPLAALTDGRNAILAVGMNGEPLPFEHGFPVRMVVPGLYGYVSATKWLVKMEVTQYSKATSYWAARGWSQKGPIKLESRIDVPQSGSNVPAGTVIVAGVAWDQHTGIKAVQIQVDNGPWNDADLADAISIDTWRQWRWEWPAPKGSHTVRVRATNANGEVQTSAVQDVVPNGATGYHTINVTVS